MLGSTVLEIIIILVFIFLIYSLFTSILVEALSSIFRLRARNLKHGICRMLQDTQSTSSLKGFLNHLRLQIESLFDRNAEQRSFVSAFYQQPSIKYLGRNNLDSTPSYISPDTFAQAIVHILSRELDLNTMDNIKISLGYEELVDPTFKIPKSEWDKIQKKIEEAPQDRRAELVSAYLREFESIEPEPYFEFDERQFETLMDKIRSDDNHNQFTILKDWMKDHSGRIVEIEPETRLQLCILLREANEELDSFKVLLKTWFSETMNRSVGWYKKKIAFLSFFIGLVLVFSFKVDIIFIGYKLKNDIGTREALMAEVQLLSGNNSMEVDSTLKESMLSSFVGINDVLSLPNRLNWTGHSCGYLISFVSYLLSAMFISFGAPFWFDILNKLMKFRSSLQISSDDDIHNIRNKGSSSISSSQKAIG